MSKKLTQQEAELKVSKYNNEYELVSIYTKGTEPATLKHKCGHVYTITRYKSFFEGKNRCPECYPIESHHISTKRLTEQDIIDRVKDQTKGEYSYVSGFKNTKIKMKIKHNTCNHIFDVTADMFLGKKQTRCPECSNKNRGKYAIKENYLQSILDDSHDGHEYIWNDEYSGNNKDKHSLTHKNCNNTYFVRPNDFQQGYRCPYCSIIKNESYYVSYIKSYLEDNNIEYETEVKFDSLKYKNKLRIDFKFSNLLLELDGIQHFRSTFSLDDHNETKKRDVAKNNWAVHQNEYSFIRIPYNLDYSEFDIIISSFINGKPDIDKIKEHKIYYYDSNADIVYNSYSYYATINENYFVE